MLNLLSIENFHSKPFRVSFLPQNNISKLLAFILSGMASSQQLTGLLEQSGMPNRKWWDGVESAYNDMCQILTEDINTEELSNRASRPMIVILPTGNHACKLGSRDELLRCVAFGTIRADLFVEVAWQNIIRAQDKGLKVKVYEVSERRLLLSLSGFIFSLSYIECPELVRS